MCARTHDDGFAYSHAVEYFHKFIIRVTNLQLATLWSFRCDHIREILP